MKNTFKKLLLAAMAVMLVVATLSLSACFEEDDTGTGNACEHVWDNGTVIVAPTYAKEGSKEYSCTLCGEKKTETIDKLALPVDDPDETKAVAADANLKQVLSDVFSDATKSAVEITLPAGEFSLKNETAEGSTSFKGKTIIFNGKSAEESSYLNTKTTDTGGEHGSDYSFDGAKAVVFKNMTINLGDTNYNGFVRPEKMVFENCVINGRGSYWGTGSVLFVNCKFNNDNGYNLWLYSGTSFEFESCTFTSAKGKFIHAYQEQADGNLTVKVIDCTFKGGEINKAAVAIKKKNGNIWDVTITNATLDNVNVLYKVNAPEDPAGTNKDYSNTKVTVNGKLVFKGDAEITE